MREQRFAAGHASLCTYRAGCIYIYRGGHKINPVGGRVAEEMAIFWCIISDFWAGGGGECVAGWAFAGRGTLGRKGGVWRPEGRLIFSFRALKQQEKCCFLLFLNKNGLLCVNSQRALAEVN